MTVAKFYIGALPVKHENSIVDEANWSLVTASSVILAKRYLTSNSSLGTGQYL